MGYVERMLGQNEKKVFLTHQHWMVLTVSAVVNLALAILILVVGGFGATTIGAAQPGLGSIVFLIAVLLLVVPIARFVMAYLVWTNREYIITNRRVIQISGVINKNVFDSSLEKVNDVKMTQSFFGQMFDYGDVEIMTAAEEGENLFRRILSPVKFKTAMLNQKELLAMDEGLRVGGAPAATPDVPKLIEGLDQLRKQGLITEEEFQRKKQDLLSRI